MTKKTTKNKKNTKKQEAKTSNFGKISLGALLMLLAFLCMFGETQSTLGGIFEVIFSSLFGNYYKIIFSPIIFIFGSFLILKENFSPNKQRFIGLFLYFLSINNLIGAFDFKYSSMFNLYPSLSDLFGPNLTKLVALILFFFSLYLIFKINYKEIIKKAIKAVPNMTKNNYVDDDFEEVEEEKPKTKKSVKSKVESQKEIAEQKEIVEIKKALEKKLKSSQTQIDIDNAPKKITIQKIFKKEEKPIDTKKIEIQKEKNIQQKSGSWKLPSIDLLKNIGGDISYDIGAIQDKEDEIVDKLRQFKIDVNMQGFRVGPTVIQFRLKPQEGVKLNKIENLKKDLTLALHAKSIRIQAPIPGEGVVGIEVPNDNRQAVGLKELISSSGFANKKLEIPIAVGKDVNGDLVIGDLAKMPHLLIAGQTGSGKSVGMNGFLVSLLYKFTPSELKMILIDPKMVELSIYNGIPHLLTPVITNPDKALNSLKWAVAEMLRRYDLATKVNARNLKEYNAKVSSEEKLPYIVIVVDELADLMMSGNKKEVEGSIARIAQMARAVGMHLIIATQRPSVDVITGLIKANIPSRIAFTVASQIDSRTVIDKAGAEDLLGRGDMLYFPTGSMEPERVQGVLVETDEIESIINEIKLTIDPDMNIYDDEIVNGKSKLSGSILDGYNGDQDEEPELVEKAILVVREAKKGSTSLIQRKLGLGYARAAKILDILEEMGIVGPSNGSKPREVYD